jgi:excisionase family DNA binding protein
VDNHEYMTIKEVAQLMRVTPRTVKRWIRAGVLKPVRLGGTVRIKRSHLHLQMEKREWGELEQREDPILG